MHFYLGQNTIIFNMDSNMKLLTQHLDDVNEAYFQHFGHAIRFAGTMAIGSVACLVHSVFPFLCTKTGSSIITKMHHDMVTHRDSLSHTANLES